MLINNELQVLVNLIIFFFGFCGILYARQNIIVMLICIEVLLLSVNLNFIFFSAYLDDLVGQVFSLFILTVAASESAIGLAILISYYRVRGNMRLDSISILKG